MLERGRVYSQILTFCITPRKFSEIVQHLDKKPNNVAMLLQQLQSYGFINKTEPETYLTTSEGVNYSLKNTADVEDGEEKIVRLISINILYKKEFDSILRIWVPLKQFFRPSDKTTVLERYIRILFNLPFQKRKLVDFKIDPAAEEMVKRAYWISQKHIPDDCKDEFERYSEKISQICERAVESQEVFRLIKFFSLSLGERIKRNTGMRLPASKLTNVNADKR